MIRYLVALFFIVCTQFTYASANCTCQGNGVLVESSREYIKFRVSEGLVCKGYACGIKEREEYIVYFEEPPSKFNYSASSAKVVAKQKTGTLFKFAYDLSGGFGNVKNNWQFKKLNE